MTRSARTDFFLQLPDERGDNRPNIGEAPRHDLALAWRPAGAGESACDT